MKGGSLPLELPIVSFSSPSVASLEVFHNKSNETQLSGACVKLCDSEGPLRQILTIIAKFQANEPELTHLSLELSVGISAKRRVIYLCESEFELRLWMDGEPGQLNCEIGLGAEQSQACG